MDLVTCNITCEGWLCPHVELHSVLLCDLLLSLGDLYESFEMPMTSVLCLVIAEAVRGCVLENQVLRSDARTWVPSSLLPRSLTVPGAPGMNWTAPPPMLCLMLSSSSCLENQILQIFVGFSVHI